MVNEYAIKKEICEIGKRIYNRGMVAANDGNISVKISENEFLCTPTGVSKGFMTPDHIYVDVSSSSPKVMEDVWNVIRDTGVQFADGALLEAEYAAWETEVMKGYEAQDGFGLKLM